MKFALCVLFELMFLAPVYAADTEKSHSVTRSTIILVQSVVDDRTYHEFPLVPNDNRRPEDESVPTMRHLADTKASTYIKARAYARAGGGSGGVLGEILLDGGQTVSSLVQDNLMSALREAGFRVTTNPLEAGKSPLVLNVHIRQFWSWPGASDWWNGDVETAIETSFDAGGAVAVPTVKIHADYVLRWADLDDAKYWMKSVNMALKFYRAQVAEAFSRLP